MWEEKRERREREREDARLLCEITGLQLNQKMTEMTVSKPAGLDRHSDHGQPSPLCQEGMFCTVFPRSGYHEMVPDKG